MKLRTRVKINKEKYGLEKLSMNMIKYLNNFLCPRERIKMLAINKRIKKNLKGEEVYQIYKKFKRNFTRLCKNKTHCETKCRNNIHDPLCLKNEELDIINIHPKTVSKITKYCNNCYDTCCLRCSKRLLINCSNKFCPQKYCKNCKELFEKCKECDRNYCNICYINFKICFLCKESMCGKCHHKLITFKNDSLYTINNKRRNAINNSNIDDKRKYICY